MTSVNECDNVKWNAFRAAARAVNAGYAELRKRGGRCGLLGSSGGWRAADTGGV